MAAIVNNSVVLPVEYAKGVITGIIGRSKALELGYRLRNMTGKQLKLNVLENLPYAGWVKNTQTVPNEEGTEINRKPLSVLAWAGKDLTAETIACIVPVSRETLEDVADYVDLAGTLQEQVIGAFNEVIDATAFFGVGSPWNDFDGIAPEAVAVGAVINWDGSAGTSFYEAISKAMKYVETSGYLPDAIVGGPSLNSAFRDSITTLGINVTDQGQIGSLYKHISLTGAFNEAEPTYIVGDFKRGFVYSFREEMRMDISRDATLVDPTSGTPLYNLFQQNMLAFRFELRMGMAVANPVNRINSTAKRYPFAVIKAPAVGSN